MTILAKYQHISNSSNYSIHYLQVNMTGLVSSTVVSSSSVMKTGAFSVTVISEETCCISWTFIWFLFGGVGARPMPITGRGISIRLAGNGGRGGAIDDASSIARATASAARRASSAAEAAARAAAASALAASSDS